MERLATEIIKQLADKEKIATFLNELSISKTTRSVSTYGLKSHILVARLEGTDAGVLQKMAQEELDMNIDDLLT